jgi:hypothetical protein
MDGKSLSKLYNVRASDAGEEVICIAGGDGGRDGGSFIVNLAAGGVIGGVLPPLCFLKPMLPIAGEAGGEVGTYGRRESATSERQITAIRKVASAF